MREYNGEKKSLGNGVLRHSNFRGLGDEEEPAKGSEKEQTEPGGHKG